MGHRGLRGLHAPVAQRDARRPGRASRRHEHGKSLTTLALARWLGERQQDGRNLAFVIGGPDGLGAGILAKATLRWSLSALTFPHAMVRVILAEQLYRAQSVLQNHPYHRE
jgi:23S rRNA (pseudouridine1915-N3)-methyltransferase